MDEKRHRKGKEKNEGKRAKNDKGYSTWVRMRMPVCVYERGKETEETEREREERGRRLRGEKGVGAMLEARRNMEKVERMGTKSRGRMEREENEKKFAQTNSRAPPARSTNFARFANRAI